MCVYGSSNLPALLTSLIAVERLAAQSTMLPAEFARSLAEDLEYARFGAALPELPWFGGWSHGMSKWLKRDDPPRFAQLFKERAPVGFGLKVAELVANGALVGTDAGLAFLAGHFTQLAVARSLESSVRKLAHDYRARNETPNAAAARIEWAQSLYLVRELHGTALVGTSAVRSKLQIRKDSGPKGIGRGLYELIRVASHDAVGEAPSKVEVDAWMRGLYLFSLALASPLGKLKSLDVRTMPQEWYRGVEVDVWAQIEAALGVTREVLVVIGGLIRRNSFTPRSRGKVFEILPEGPPHVSAPAFHLAKASGAP